MMRIFILAIFCFLSIGLSAQQTPIVSKVTATWCPNCGNWGWDFMEDMKDEFVEGPVTLLGVHYSGDLENETSRWFASAIGWTGGQPRFYLNDTRISANGSNWSDAIPTIKSDAEAIQSETQTELSLAGLSWEGRILTLDVNVSSLPTSGDNYYLASYIYENNVSNSQAGAAGNNALHPNVLRDVMASSPEGTQISDAGIHTSVKVISSDWDIDEVGILSVLWSEQGGNYDIVGSISLPNVSSISSTTELLDGSAFDIKVKNQIISVATENEDNYQLKLSDISGREISSTQFETSVEESTATLQSGIYLVTISTQTGLYSQQVFVR